MDELNKQQIVMVTLLVSFVTSIATGIVTVSLMDQAPRPVTQTINRVIEKTVEKIVPVNQNASVITKEVIVREESVIAEGVERALPSIVRIYRAKLSENEDAFVGLGVIVSKNGHILMDKSRAKEGERYVVRLNDGTDSVADIIAREDSNGIAVLQLVIDSKIKITPIEFSNSDSLKLGQTVIALTGERKDAVLVGIVSSLDHSSDNQVRSIDTNITLKDYIPGAPLINVKGELLGLKLRTTSDPRTSYIATNVIKPVFEAALSVSASAKNSN